MERILREGSPEQQESLLREELRRYSAKLWSYGGP